MHVLDRKVKNEFESLLRAPDSLDILFDYVLTSLGDDFVVELNGIKIVLKNVVGVKVLFDDVLAKSIEEVITLKDVGLGVDLADLLLCDVLLDMFIILVVVDVFQDEINVVVAAPGLVR